MFCVGGERAWTVVYHDVQTSAGGGVQAGMEVAVHVCVFYGKRGGGSVSTLVFCVLVG